MRFAALGEPDSVINGVAHVLAFPRYTTANANNDKNRKKQTTNKIINCKNKYSDFDSNYNSYARLG